MTKQEYDAIMQEMKTHTLPHRYVSVEGARPHLEEMAVVGYDAIAGIHGIREGAGSPDLRRKPALQSFRCLRSKWREREMDRYERIKQGYNFQEWIQWCKEWTEAVRAVREGAARRGRDLSKMVLTEGGK